MGFIDNFKGKQYKQEAEELKDKLEKSESELEHLKSTFTPEMYDVVKLKEIAHDVELTIERLNKTVNEKNTEIQYLSQNIENLNNVIKNKQSEIIILDEEILLQEFGLYKPQYDFENSEIYKQKITEIRDLQKALIKSDKALLATTNWTVNGSAAQGRKMVNDEKKLLLRAFNNECDISIDRVKFNTFDTAKKRIEKSCEIITKLGKTNGISITEAYKNSKLDELCLVFEYRKKKQEEKEEQKEIRARMREEAKLQKEIEEARKKIYKEQNHYKNALQKIEAQINSASEEEKDALLAKKAEIENELTEIDKSIKDIDYRESNAKAGYVYIISNIGSFGENIFKIGMTRRLDPMERVDELGDASVPFNFDVHAMIFSDNAPALETALHKAFENRKLNMINTRREFFNVTLEEIEAEVKKNFDKTVEFIKLAPAEQYRESLKIKENSNI